MAAATRDFSRAQQVAQQIVTAPEDWHRSGPRKLVLCFDGTGNKFKGDDSDSNILKIFRCLDREANDQFHYYQPGIGTYVVSSSLSHTTMTSRIRSWYLKAKDSAIGSSFDQHVVGGYRFLMRYYNPGDEIYFFGFSRGAYVARFLAEMLDHVGLLSHGNEEMVGFAWKAFSQWQAREHDESADGAGKRREMYRFMKGFRETFSRPVKRIRFLGLFDTVNSVPRFETAWMQRSKFPYTARSSAKVIRHCVSIDERRAKFRQDLIYQGSQLKAKRQNEHHHHHHHHDEQKPQDSKDGDQRYRGRRATVVGPVAPPAEDPRGRRRATLAPHESFFRPRSRSRSRVTVNSVNRSRATSLNGSEISRVVPDDPDSDDEQDVDEVWFAGGHGDVGGGWDVEPGTKPCSHIPLAYMIREAIKAGLQFDPEKLVAMGVWDTLEEAEAETAEAKAEGVKDHEAPPEIRIEASSPSLGPSQADNSFSEKEQPNWDHFNRYGPARNGAKDDGGMADGCSENGDHDESLNPFHQMLHKAHLATVHDSLEYGCGLSKMQVLSWKIMEYMPFRRMDLQPDGSWKPIRWPLPCGETRDVPDTARVHGSVIRRMKMDPKYRPGNLIVGGGGRGTRKAPEHLGIGEWECVKDAGDPIGEIWARRIVKSPTCS
ncbi:uncharacterized protein B0I36DRAFT_362548 [Microdochium trichocladiopsis]|uniref:T6SS Phospholipase effector Tle1-like catalytic domain-containing protein n=1 Tax=Microdochium trichocladiopsis TaxID=1682393 RepID=A0A9P8Y6Q9_9PEZI|nr:uncharacterized protein B0I36DRAFT_362548 [Microdochium trichocladiopsis]KAH7030728.1 hypothetical protein B0I36DRAFT_362548 [Microdochium trichocladiopsis]